MRTAGLLVHVGGSGCAVQCARLQGKQDVFGGSDLLPNSAFQVDFVAGWVFVDFDACVAHFGQQVDHVFIVQLEKNRIFISSDFWGFFKFSFNGFFKVKIFWAFQSSDSFWGFSVWIFGGLSKFKFFGFKSSDFLGLRISLDLSKYGFFRSLDFSKSSDFGFLFRLLVLLPHVIRMIISF